MYIGEIKQGEVYEIDLGQGEGSEQSGKRACIIISSNFLNETLDTFLVVPCTSKVKKFLPVHTNVMLKEPSIALSEQIRTVSRNDIKRYLQSITEEELNKVLFATYIQLGQIPIGTKYDDYYKLLQERYMEEEMNF